MTGATRRRLDLAALATVTLATAWLGRFQPPTADDWSILVHVRAVPNPVVLAAGQYRDWSGRFLPWTLMGGLIRSPDLLPWISAAFGALLCLLAGPLLRATGWRDAAGARARTDWIAAAALILGLRFTIGQSVFWASNGVTYFLTFALGLGWWQVMRRPAAPRPLRGPTGLAIAFAASLALGLGHELLAPVLLFAGAGLAWVRRAGPGDATRLRLAALAGLAAGTVLLAVAPGNAARAREFQSGYPVDPVILFRNFRDVLGPCMATGVPAFCAGALAGALLGGGPGFRFADVLRPVALVLLAASTMLPLAAAPAFAVSRAYVHAALLLFAAGAWQGTVIRVAAEPALRHARWRAALRLAPVLLFVVWAGWTARQVMQAAPFARDIAARHARLAGLRGSMTDAVVDPLRAPPPHALYLDDLRADPANWINRAIAGWYGLHSVRLATPAPAR